jgi:hypothetical protein
MAFTDNCDLFGSVHEDAINLVVLHLMRQRPSLFNYATPLFHSLPHLFCVPIRPAQAVIDAGNPLFTEQDPLPVFGAPFPIGINFCVQITKAQIDFHPGNAIQLPPELAPLPQQRFALRAQACAGIGCPPAGVVADILPEVERTLVEQQKLAVGKIKEHDRPRPPRPPRDPVVLPTRELICVCLDVYAVGHFEWGSVPGSGQRWLKAKLDGLEIVDLKPDKLEAAIECYVATVLRLGILPRVMVPMEKMVFDITKQAAKWGLTLGKQVTLEPSAVPADVPNNPAVEDDQLKAFVKLVVTP